MAKRPCLIGVFPPPFHGMSNINEFIKNIISQITPPYVINCSPNFLDRSFFVRFLKFTIFVKCFSIFFTRLTFQQINSIYIGLSGGYGQFYDFLFILIGRLFRRKIFIHHHSYQYLTKYSLLTKCLVYVAGVSSVHIVACQKMKADLYKFYPDASNIEVISGIFSVEAKKTPIFFKKAINRIGFVSNLSVDKGVFEFLKVANLSNSHNLPFQFILAGPYQDAAIEKLVSCELKKIKNTDYIGPIYGDDKYFFYENIDVFLFPTKYINESEGLVIHEAMSRGVPVVAYARGCIENIVVPSVGYSIPANDNFLEPCFAKLNYWASNPPYLESASIQAYSQFLREKEINMNKIHNLCIRVIGDY